MTKEESIVQFILSWLSSNEKIADKDTARQKARDLPLGVFLDSLDVMELVTAIEERYGVELDEIIGSDSIPEYRKITPACLAKAVTYVTED